MNVVDTLTFMPTSLDALYLVAEPHAGYLTTTQAADAGVSRQQLSYLARTGSLERVAHGIYRLRRFPSQPFEDVIVACLWVGDGAVASHDTALAIYGLTDESPPVVHLSVPRPFRGTRDGVIVHSAVMTDVDRTERHGVPVTTPERSLIDVLRRSGPMLAREATAQALDRGLVTDRSLRTALARTGLSAELTRLVDATGRR